MPIGGMLSESLWQKKHVSVVKIKAHQAQYAIDNLPLATRIPAPGNQAADIAAKRGVRGHA
eukprot:12347997-Prorocentrum_lima.AAC.1